MFMSRTFKMAQQVNSLAMHPGGPSSTPGAHGGRRKRTLRSCPLTLTHKLWYACTLTHKQRQSKITFLEARKTARLMRAHAALTEDGSPAPAEGGAAHNCHSVWGWRPFWCLWTLHSHAYTHMHINKQSPLKSLQRLLQDILVKVPMSFQKVGFVGFSFPSMKSQVIPKERLGTHSVLLESLLPPEETWNSGLSH